MSEIPATLGIRAVSQATFRTELLDTHVHNMAIPALWEKSYLCPCRNRATRQPDQTCQVCHGRGIAYMSPEKFTIMIQSQEKGVFNGDLGLIDAGTAIGTPDRSIRVAFRDRITVPNARVSQSFILDASQRRIENGFYMSYDVNEIEFATTLGRELVEGTDYTVDLSKNLFFPKEHLLEENISLNILTTLRYMVADLLKEHRYGRVSSGTLEQLQQKLLLKREDLFIDKEAFEENVEKTGFVDTKRQTSLEGLNGFFMGSADQ